MAAEPEEPKRPQTAYWVWLGENRDALAKEAGSAAGSVVGKLGGAKWKAMSADAKKPFEDRAAKLRSEYDAAMDKFKACGGQVGKRRLEKKEAKEARSGKKAKKQGGNASGKPKKPLDAYRLFVGENRPALAKEAGSTKIPAVAKLAGEKWKAMSAAAKKPFEDKAAALKAEYGKALAEWEKSGGGGDKNEGDGDDDDDSEAEVEAKDGAKERKQARADKKAKKEAQEASGKPKRPQNAYWMWLGENREALEKEAGTRKGPVVGKLAGVKWKALPAAAKKPFEDRAAVSKAEYGKALAEWKKKNGGGGDDNDDDE